MALVCICLGLRISEALGLKWGDVDWLDSTLQIARGMVRQHEGKTKTDESESKLAVDSEMLQVLKTWRQAIFFSSDEDWMFASPVQLGRLPWSYPHLWRKVSEAARDAGIGKLSLHDLRHTCRAWQQPLIVVGYARTITNCCQARQVCRRSCGLNFPIPASRAASLTLRHK